MGLGNTQIAGLIMLFATLNEAIPASAKPVFNDRQDLEGQLKGAGLDPDKFDQFFLGMQEHDLAFPAHLVRTGQTQACLNKPNDPKKACREIQQQKGKADKANGAIKSFFDSDEAKQIENNPAKREQYKTLFTQGAYSHRTLPFLNDDVQKKLKHIQKAKESEKLAKAAQKAESKARTRH